MSCVNIIIPVYNSEKYLTELFESILRQSFQDFQIIAINDCSSDASEKILLEYKKKLGEKLFYFKNDKNLKQGPTRNVGLEISESMEAKYTVFLDADDIVEPDYLESMINVSEKENADIVICGIERFDNDTKKTICFEAVKGGSIDLSNGVNLKELAYINPAPYNKLYKSSVIHGYKFSDMKRSEDTCYFFEILSNVSKIAFTNKVSYKYRIHSSSLTGTIGTDVCESMMFGFKSLINRLDYKKLAYKDELETQIFIRVACGGVSRASFSNIKDSNFLISKAVEYLDLVIPDWRTNKYLSVRKPDFNAKAFTLRVVAFLYKIGLAKIFIYIYYFNLKILRKDIRM